MQFKIYNVDFIYNNENVIEKVRLRYDATENSNSINGTFEIGYEDYLLKANDLTALAGDIKTKLVEKLSA